MGISYHPVAMFGIRFQKRNEVERFLVEHSKIVLDEDEDLNEQVEAFFPQLHLTALNMFETQEAVLGYNMTLGETIEQYLEMWNKEFPGSNLTPEPILAVRTW